MLVSPLGKLLMKSFFHFYFFPIFFSVHGNTRRQPKHAISPDVLQYIVHFLFNYAEQHAVLLPGRVPGYKEMKLKLLPSSTTKKAVWSLYVEAGMESFVRTVAYSTFLQIWKQYCPNLMVMKPMTDLCALCQNNSKLILRLSNRSEAEKSVVGDRKQMSN